MTTIFKSLFYDTFIKWFKRIQLHASMTLNVFPRRKFKRNSLFDLFLSLSFSAAQTKTWLKERKKNSGLRQTCTINTVRMTLSGDFARLTDLQSEAVINRVLITECQLIRTCGKCQNNCAIQIKPKNVYRTLGIWTQASSWTECSLF